MEIKTHQILWTWYWRLWTKKDILHPFFNWMQNTITTYFFSTFFLFALSETSFSYSCRDRFPFLLTNESKVEMRTTILECCLKRRHIRRARKLGKWAIFDTHLVVYHHSQSCCSIHLYSTYICHHVMHHIHDKCKIPICILLNKWRQTLIFIGSALTLTSLTLLNLKKMWYITHLI